jgi:hypothetical protein
LRKREVVYASELHCLYTRLAIGGHDVWRLVTEGWRHGRAVQLSVMAQGSNGGMEELKKGKGGEDEAKAFSGLSFHLP